MLDPYLSIALLFVIGWISGRLAGKLTCKVNSYMMYGMILGFVRRAAAKYFARNTGIDFDRLEIQINEDIPADGAILENRANAYEDIYAMIAAKKKGLMPFICAECMSEWINLPFSIGIACLFGLDLWQIVLVVIVSSIISRDEL